MDFSIGKVCEVSQKCLEEECFYITNLYIGPPGGSNGEESTCNAGDQGLIPGLGRSSGKGNGCPLQYSWQVRL